MVSSKELLHQVHTNVNFVMKLGSLLLNKDILLIFPFTIKQVFLTLGSYI